MRLLSVALLSALLVYSDESARSLASRAAKAEKAGLTADAILLYNQAAAKDPQNQRYAAKSRMLTQQALLRTSQEPQVSTVESSAPSPELPALPDNVGGRISEADLHESRTLLPPPRVELKPGPFTLTMNGDARSVIDQAARELGLEVIYDENLPSTGQPIKLTFTEATPRELLDTVNAATGTFAVPLSPHRLLIAQDSIAKRQQLEPNVAVVLSLPDPVSAQELQELARSVQQTMELQKFAIDLQRRMVLMRDKVSKVRPAQLIFEQLLGARPAISIQVEILEVRRNANLAAGLRLPTSTQLFNLERISIGRPVIPEGVDQLATFGGGATRLGMTLTDAAIVATLLKTVGAQRQRAEIRTTDGSTGQLLVGERYPILTAGYFGASGAPDPDAFTPPPSFQFENLGLTLKVTPRAHGLDEITVEIDAEYKLLTGATINGIPVLSNRKVTSTVRMRNGEWALLAGLESITRSAGSTGLPLLMQIPVFGPLFRQNTVDTEQTETLVLLRPTLLSSPNSEIATREIRLGSETHPRVPLD